MKKLIMTGLKPIRFAALLSLPGKPYRLILMFFLIPVGLLAQQKGFVITGTITGLADNTKVSLTDANNPSDTIAKADVTKGSFVLKGTVAEPNLYQLNFGGAGKKAVLFI